MAYNGINYSLIRMRFAMNLFRNTHLIRNGFLAINLRVEKRHLPNAILILVFFLICSLSSSLLTACSRLPIFSSPTQTPNTVSTETRLPLTLPTLESQIISSNDQNPSTLTIPSLSKNVFVHPKNLFYLIPPDGWLVTTDEDSATFTDPSMLGYFTVSVVNVGYPLEEDAFNRLVQSRETNAFGDVEKYIPMSWTIDNENGIVQVTKKVAEDGNSMTMITNYFLEESWLCIFEWELQPEFALAVDEHISKPIIKSFRLNKQAANQLKVYAAKYYTQINSDRFSFDVPVFWSRRESFGEYTQVNTFSSPDEHAWIQTLLFEDETVISKRVAGLVTLFLLNNYYTKDIEVISDRIYPDGREQLIWFSPSGNFHGISNFTTLPPSLLLYSAIYEDTYSTIYKTLLEEILNTFRFHSDH